MAGSNPDLVIRVAANVAALQTDMAAAVATLRSIQGAAADTAASTSGLTSSLDALGSSWVVRVAEGQLLRDAVREVLSGLKDLAEFLPEVAMKGAAFEDVKANFDHLTASAGLLSDTLLTTLRAGTHGTVDDMTLMLRANKDLVAGLDLTDAQFATLAQGAFALAKATGVDTAAALDTMSDAMVRGTQKGIAALTGKLDLTSAETAYAATVGGTGKQLDAVSKLEADRLAMLAAVEAALGRAGDQEDSLKDKVDQGAAAWENFKLQLGLSIAQSPVIAAGFDTIRTALAAAVGGDQAKLIATITSYVNDFAIKVVDLGIGAVAAAGVMIQAWNLISVPILAVETVIVGVIALIGEAVLAAEKVAGALHLVDPDEVQRVQETQDAVRAMTVSLADQTAEAAKGAMGWSASQVALEKVGGALFETRDAMVAASTATVAGTTAIVEHAAASTTATATLKTNATLEAAQITETTKLYDAYYKVVAAGSHDKVAMQITDAWLAADAEIAALEKTKVITLEDYDIIWAKAQQTADNIIQKTLESDQYTREHYKLIADQADIAYQFAIDHSGSYTQTEIQNLLAIDRNATQAYNHWAQTATDALDTVVAKSKTSTAAVAASVIGVVDALSMADVAFDANLDTSTAKVETLAGAYITALAAKVAFDTGGTSAIPTVTITATNKAALIAELQGIEAEYVNNPGRQAGVNGSTGLQANDAAGWSAMLQEQVRFASLKAALPGYAGGVQNAPGGWSMVGERGPEAMYVPPGATIRPNGTGGGDTHHHFYITQPLGTPQQVAAAIDDAIMKRQRALGTRFAS